MQLGFVAGAQEAGFTLREIGSWRARLPIALCVQTRV